MKQFYDVHPDPSGKYWTIILNQDLPQVVDRIKEISTSVNMGVRRKGYILFNSAGDMIGMQVYDEPLLKAPSGEESVEKTAGFNLNFKMPKALGIFPSYKVLVELLKIKKDDEDS